MSAMAIVLWTLPHTIIAVYLDTTDLSWTPKTRQLAKVEPCP